MIAILHELLKKTWPKAANGCDVTQRAIFISERDYDILASAIAQMLTSQPFLSLCQRHDTN